MRYAVRLEILEAKIKALREYEEINLIDKSIKQMNIAMLIAELTTLKETTEKLNNDHLR